MKTIAVFLTCLAYAMASPNYGHAATRAGAYGGYEAPAVKAAPASYGGYEAPAVKAAPASYGGYEAPAVKAAPAAYGYEEPALVKAPVIPIVRYLREDDNYGSYNLQTEGGDGTTHSETGTMIQLNNPESEGPVNVKRGSYSWTSPEGQVFKTEYIADENGFQVFGDHLPKPVPVPAEHRAIAAQQQTFSNYNAYAEPAPVRAAPVPAYGVRAEPYNRFDIRGDRY